MTGPKDGSDPRLQRTSDGFAPQGDADDPVVGRIGRGTNVFLVVGIFAVLAVALFLLLNARRTQEVASLVTPVSRESVAAQAPPPPLQVVVKPPPAPPVQVAAALPPAPVVLTPSADTSPNLRAPAVVVDLQTNGLPINTAAPGAASSSAAPALKPAIAAGAANASGGAISGLLAAAAPGEPFSANEQFAARASETLPEAAVATQLTHLSAMITQGATIAAVLETAVNSDLPGYTRAVVSRDVRSFDGKAVLIPRGSRLIGQYRSALSLGQSRVFVIWTRVIRPDGVSVQIGSPGEDALGQGGLTGEVNSHFFTRFGGSVLLSVLNTGLAAVAGTPSTQVVIGSPAAALGAAANAVIPTGENIFPTIKVNQGATITIFVARDLDFSLVKPVPAQ